MSVSYTVIPSGDMAGSLGFRVTADESFDPDDAVKQVLSYPTTQPVIILFVDNAISDLTERFVAKIRSKLQGVTLVYLTSDEAPTRLWYAFDRVILNTSVSKYDGTPTQEVHLYWNGEDYYPVVAPLGAAQTHVYCYTGKGNYEQLKDWVRQAPYQIGIIGRSL